MDKILVGLAFGFMMMVNVLANALPINGISSGEVSDSYPNLFAPAGITFSIWGVIYLLLLGYSLYQLGWIGKIKNKKLVAEINKYLIPNMVLNGLWLFAWHYRLIGLSVGIMGLILMTLIKINERISKDKLESKENILVALPMSVYFGWITVATIANITAFLVSVGWNGFGLSEEAWMIAVLLVGTAIGVARIREHRRAAYGLVLIWAYGGILYKHVSPQGFGGQYLEVMATTIICIIVITIAILLAGRAGLKINKN